MSHRNRRSSANQRTGVRARVLRKQTAPETIKTIRKKLMNQSITFTGDWALHGILSDLGVDLALSPFYRIGFDIDEAGIQLLSDQYRERVFRARQWFGDEKLTWTNLLLRFEDNAFLVAHGNGTNWAEIIAPRADQVRELHAEIRKLLQGENKPKRPAFFMLRYDYNDISADPIENLPEAVTDDFLRLCYGEDILEWVAEFAERTVSRAGGLTIFDGPPGDGQNEPDFGDDPASGKDPRLLLAARLAGQGALFPGAGAVLAKAKLASCRSRKGDRHGRRRAFALAADGRQPRSGFVAAQHRGRPHGPDAAFAHHLFGQREDGGSRSGRLAPGPFDESSPLRAVEPRSRRAPRRGSRAGLYA